MNRHTLKSFLVLTLTIGLFAPTLAQRKNLIGDLLQKSPELFRTVTSRPDLYDVQILYTQIDRDAQNRPLFRSYSYKLDKKRYFYPASTVKLPAVLLALEKLNELKINRNTPMLTDSAYARQTRVRADATAENGLPSVAHYAKKILLVSDNDAFNRLYEFVGQRDMNERLYRKGYRNLRIVHRLESPMNADQNRHTNPVRFVQDGKVLYEQPARVNTKPIRSDSIIRRGIGFMRNDSLIKEPFDFTRKNFFALEDQQAMLKAVLFPEAVPAKNRFNLNAGDYGFLYQYLSQLPRETTYPKYDSTFYDSYCKFLLTGDQKTSFPKSIRIFNKVGDAYGYLIDNAYIVDFERGVEFMLSAVISCNSDGIFNDDAYDYDKIGYPFLSNLGRVIFDYDAKRKRLWRPDVRKFQLKYDR
ncbi:MAG: class A beta-lactamase-related serine hydrolase [Rudanella sp.]|nr:class A beta-lactamase-related serine hydrolase [Rudanella sp.]